MKLAVLDTNAIIGLAKGEVLDGLPQLYEAMFSVPEIAEEVLDPIAKPHFDKAASQWLRLKAPDEPLPSPSARGLSETDRNLVALSRNLGGADLITSDQRLAAEARKHHIRAIKVTDVVVGLKLGGHILTAQEVLNRMIRRGFFIDEATHEEAVKAAGEARGAYDAMKAGMDAG